MNPSENINFNRAENADPAVTFHLKSDEEGDEQIARNKLSTSSLAELDNDELDESIDDAGSDDSRVYHKKLNKVNRAILHPKKNLILLSHMDAEISKSKLGQISFSIENKENQQTQQPATKRRKYSSMSGNASSSFNDELGLDSSQMEQVVDAGNFSGDNDSQLSSNFKNCLLKTMNEILRTNLQLNRKIDQIKEQNFYMNKRLKRLEQIVKIGAVKDQEVEDELDLMSDMSDDIKTHIKQEKLDIRSNEKTSESNKALESVNQQQLMHQSKPSLADSVAKRSDLIRPSPNGYHRAQNYVLQQQQHPAYSYGYTGTGPQQPHHHHHSAHPADSYHFHQQYRYNTSGINHHGSVNGANGSIHTYRPTQSSSSSNMSYLPANSSTSAQNPKTASALAAAVAAAMAASAGQAEYSQESVEENEYDDSLEEETIGAFVQSDAGLINGQYSPIVPQHAPIRHIPSSIVDQLELSDDVERLVSRDVIKRCIRKAKHRGNFAANLAAELFSKEERITCNCTGTRGKRQLSPRRLQIVKEITFRMYNSHAVKQASNISGGQQSAAALLQDFEEAWRKECITAIDAKNRSIGRDLIKNTSSNSIASNQQSVSPISSTTPASNPALSASVTSEVY